MTTAHYHYTECGLDNVWLANGFKRHKTPYGRAVSVEAADGLHRLLAMKLVEKPGRLTGKEFRFLRLQLGLSQASIARAQGVTEQVVSLWERHGKVPKANDALLRLCHEARANGNEKITQILNRMNEVERLVHQTIVATATRKGWKSRVTLTDHQPARGDALEAA